MEELNLRFRLLLSHPTESGKDCSIYQDPVLTLNKKPLYNQSVLINYPPPRDPTTLPPYLTNIKQSVIHHPNLNILTRLNPSETLSHLSALSLICHLQYQSFLNSLLKSMCLL